MVSSQNIKHVFNIEMLNFRKKEINKTTISLCPAIPLNTIHTPPPSSFEWSDTTLHWMFFAILFLKKSENGKHWRKIVIKILLVVFFFCGNIFRTTLKKEFFNPKWIFHLIWICIHNTGSALQVGYNFFSFKGSCEANTDEQASTNAEMRSTSARLLFGRSTSFDRT